VLCGLRDRCIAAMLATHRDAKAELNRRSQACAVLTGTGIRVAGKSSRAGGAAKMESSQGNAPCSCGLQPQPFACSVAGH
jgi:hypothetical protein